MRKIYFTLFAFEFAAFKTALVEGALNKAMKK
jgi:hypothetical protein